MPSRAWPRLASLAEERADLASNSLEFLEIAPGGDEVFEVSAAVVLRLFDAPTLALGCLACFLLGAQAGSFPLLTLALRLGLARGLLLQPAALGGEPLLFGSPRLPGGLFPGKLFGACTLGPFARGALLSFPPGPGLPLLFRGPGAALGLCELAAHQVADVGVIDRPAAVLLADPARRIHHGAAVGILWSTAAGRQHEEEDDGCFLVHDSPFKFARATAPGRAIGPPHEAKDTRSALGVL